MALIMQIGRYGHDGFCVWPLSSQQKKRVSKQVRIRPTELPERGPSSGQTE